MVSNNYLCCGLTSHSCRWCVVAAIVVLGPPFSVWWVSRDTCGGWWWVVEGGWRAVWTSPIRLWWWCTCPWLCFCEVTVVSLEKIDSYSYTQTELFQWMVEGKGVLVLTQPCTRTTLVEGSWGGLKGWVNVPHPIVVMVHMHMTVFLWSHRCVPRKIDIIF